MYKTNFKQLLLLLVACALSFASCRDSNLPSQELAISNQKNDLYQKIVTTQDKETQRNLFGDLKPQEKLGLWQYKFSQIDASKYTASQLEVIQELNSILSIDVFIADINPVIESAWLKKAERLFDKETIYYLAYHLDAGPATEGLVKPWCECNSDAACSGALKCDKSQHAPCSVARQCGFLWGSLCYGLCVVKPINNDGTPQL